MFGIGSAEYHIEGAGYGDLVNLMYKAFTCGMQQDLVDRIISDYRQTKEEQNAPMEGDMMPDAPMGMPEGDAPMDMEAPMEGDMA